jgi:predicted nuclease with TOPRIM domain
MKKFVYILFALFVLSACSEDTSEYKQQRDELEQNNQALQTQIAKEQEELKKRKAEQERLKQRLEELERVKSGMVSDPVLLTMEFKRSDNTSLSKDVICDVYSSTGIVNCWLPELDDSKT